MKFVIIIDDWKARERLYKEINNPLCNFQSRKVSKNSMDWWLHSAALMYKHSH